MEFGLLPIIMKGVPEKKPCHSYDWVYTYINDPEKKSNDKDYHGNISKY